MNQIEWISEYSVNNVLMDDHHKHLFEIINNLYEGIKIGERDRTLSSVLIDLLEYSRLHFSEEEQLMRSIKYPEISDHIEAHIKYLEKVKEIRDKYEASGKEILVLMEIQDFLRNWWIDHINNLDKKYGEMIADMEAE